jgi:superfamily II DNA or RNA helicase
VAARLGRLRGGACTSTREIDGFLTALTYQSLATFDDGAELDESPRRVAARRSAPDGRALVARLKEIGDLTLVLDECHHLLEVWGAWSPSCSRSSRMPSSSASPRRHRAP